jgi:electron transport complex protein RnfG
MADKSAGSPESQQDAPAVWRSGGLLALIAVAGVSLLSGVFLLTEDRIAEQERRVVMEQLAQVLPPTHHDNDLLDDVILIRDPEFSPEPLRVFRGWLQGAPAGLVMEITAPDGYNGAIELLVGIFPDGAVSGVRVVAHRETPGLGDPIEARRSDWILGFDGRSLGDPPVERWAVRRDGGDFDQFTGATITPRAVVGAVRRALEYHHQHGEALYRTKGAEEHGP